MDGTFNKSPPLFEQLFTIYCTALESIQPVIWALLPDKREATYLRLFTAIQNLRPHCRPEKVMSDFELAATNAFQQVNYITIQKLCLFLKYGETIQSQQSTITFLHAWSDKS